MSDSSGADWIEEAGKGPLSPLGRRVADLLGDWACGIYHLYQADADLTVDWSNGHCIHVCYSGGSLATFDVDRLTRLVFLCHDRCIRCEIEPVSRTHIGILFHSRSSRHGRLSQRHPSLEGALLTHRKTFPRIECAELRTTST